MCLHPGGPWYCLGCPWNKQHAVRNVRVLSCSKVSTLGQCDTNVHDTDANIRSTSQQTMSQGDPMTASSHCGHAFVPIKPVCQPVRLAAERKYHAENRIAATAALACIHIGALAYHKRGAEVEIHDFLALAIHCHGVCAGVDLL